MAERFEKFEYRHTLYLDYLPKNLQHCTLNNFDFQGQIHLIKPIKRFIEGQTQGIFFHGGFGVGKSHLLVALYRIIVAQEDDTSDVCYMSFESALRELQRPEHEFDVDYLCEVGYLFLDDITAVDFQSGFTKETLRRIINSRYENEMRTCFTSNAGTAGLQEFGLHPHALSRINGMCEIVEVKGRDRRKK